MLASLAPWSPRPDRGIGTVLLLLCDSIAQWPGSDTVLPVNVITSLVGAPMVIFMLVRKKNLNLYR